MSTATLLAFPPSSTPLPPSEQPHLLPFNIAHTGPAPVSTYFLPRPADGRPPSPSPSSSHTEGGSAPLQLAAFRGRQVVGQPLVLPEGYAGLLIDIPAPPSSSLSSTSLSNAATAAALDASSVLGPRRSAHLLPTPTPSLSSSSTGEGFDEAEDMEAESSSTATRVTRASPRRKRAPPARYGGGGGGAGGATAAKRRNVVAANKFRVDSDSEEEEAKAMAALPDALAEEETKKKKKEEAELEQQAMTAAPALPPHTPIASASELTNDVPSSTTTPISPSPPSPPCSPADADATPALLPPGPPLPTRTLHARSTFTNITLWTPDDPVDAARDEFFRALGKGGWVELAGELHREEEEEVKDM